MNRGLVIDAAAIGKLNWQVCAQDEWLREIKVGGAVPGISQVEHAGFLYLLGNGGAGESHLLVIAGKRGENFFSSLGEQRLECFQRILKVALRQIDRSVRIPIEWRPFHQGSLLSFQSNRFSSGIKSRVYVDLRPEDSDGVYAYALINSEGDPLTRNGYDAELFSEAMIGYGEAILKATQDVAGVAAGAPQFSIALTTTFSNDDVVQGAPFSVWRDSRLTKDQLAFFNAEFDGPLRLRGAAGTGKTLVLCLRFLKEIYEKFDKGLEFRAAYITHGQETADLVRSYLAQMDERGLLASLNASGAVEVMTLHGIASGFVNYEADEVIPISLDGADGRKMQVELIDSLCNELSESSTGEVFEEIQLESGFRAASGSAERLGFLCDLIDEFSSVLETYGVRDVDLISDRYLKAPIGGKVMAKTSNDKVRILELYKGFRRNLAEIGVVSLDQFISDFVSYLNSFRWDAIRGKRGFDFVFADELHLFNRQERPVLGYLLRDPTGPTRVAVAYDPRQSPRSSFLPNDQVSKDSVWMESNLVKGAAKFELTEVFRYTPEILEFLKSLNSYFPADDLSEEWGLVFGHSMMPAGEKPVARVFQRQEEMASYAAESSKRMMSRIKGKGRVAVLALDPERFHVYLRAGIFKAGFVRVSSRDDLGLIQRMPGRVVLSSPELVAGLQFEHVFLLDANAALVGALGTGTSGLQRFVSATYLGSSRAKQSLEILADSHAGGLAQPIRGAADKGIVAMN